MNLPAFQRGEIHSLCPSPQAFLLRSIFFRTMAQVLVARKDCSKRSSILPNMAYGTVKVSSSVLKNFRAEGSQPPRTALFSPSARYLRGHAIRFVQAAPQGDTTTSGSLVTNIASWWRPHKLSGLVKNATNSGISSALKRLRGFITQNFFGADLGSMYSKIRLNSSGESQYNSPCIRSGMPVET